MFNFFDKPEYKLPKPVPNIEPPTQEETYYSIGITSENRITLKVGYTTLTMNEKGIRNLIEQLEVFAGQLLKEEEDEQS